MDGCGRQSLNCSGFLVSVFSDLNGWKMWSDRIIYSEILSETESNLIQMDFQYVHYSRHLLHLSLIDKSS